MIETKLGRVECAFVLRRLGIASARHSPLADFLASVAVVPEGSPAEARIISGLLGRHLATADGVPNPYLATALEWLAEPERVHTLAQFGPGGVEVIHLAVARGVAVECRRQSEEIVLRFPLPEQEIIPWLAHRTAGGA